jgi:hypothetical protein
MRMSAKLAGVVVFLIAITAALSADSPYAPRPDDPYSVTATVTSPTRGRFVVRVVIVDKRTGETVFHPTVDVPANMTAESFSDQVASKPQFHVRLIVDDQGKASVTFEAFERLLQRSALTVATQQ